MIKTKKSNIFDVILISVTGIGIIISAIITKQMFIKVLPCLFSLIIMNLLVKVNRLSFIMGTVNCIIYSIGYFMEGLYGSVGSALLVSAPLQILTFINWKKNANGNVVTIKKMKTREMALYSVGSLAFWGISVGVLSLLHAEQTLFDSANFTLGLVVTILQLLRYKESCYIALVASVISLSMRINMTFANTATITYLIFEVYVIISRIRMTYNWNKIYKEQNDNKTPTASEKAA